MMNEFCKLWKHHKPGAYCTHCNLDVDDYGNTEEDQLNCCYPDCGCPESRLCMGKNGCNQASAALNLPHRRNK